MAILWLSRPRKRIRGTWQLASAKPETDRPMTTRRSTGKIQVAKALWYIGPGKAELRPQPVPAPPLGEAQVQMLFSGISRGTERLVLAGTVGESEWQRMRAPLQEGNFPFPVKYGYCAVGRVNAGPDALLGKTVFCLHPHQDWFNVTVDRLTVVSDAIPPRRATLVANMETSLNALWDSGAGPEIGRASCRERVYPWV